MNRIKHQNDWGKNSGMNTSKSSKNSSILDKDTLELLLQTLREENSDQNNKDTMDGEELDPSD